MGSLPDAPGTSRRVVVKGLGVRNPDSLVTERVLVPPPLLLLVEGGGRAGGPGE